jgi:AcrR family transcriptional regulator
MKKDSAPQPAKPKRPRGRPRSFDREAALDSAMEVFWNKGFEAASLNDLTKAMGINPPSLYAAFGDKEKLFLEAIERYEARIGESCPYACEPTARASVERLLGDLAEEFTDSGHPRGCMIVMAAATATGTSAHFQQALAKQRDEGRARLRQRIQQGIKDGDLPPDADATALANFYSAIIAGMSMQARDGASRKTLLAMVETAMRAWPESPAAVKRAKRPALAA